jgi:hypothetical protein
VKEQTTGKRPTWTPRVNVIDSMTRSFEWVSNVTFSSGQKGSEVPEVASLNQNWQLISTVEGMQMD